MSLKINIFILIKKGIVSGQIKIKELIDQVLVRAKQAIVELTAALTFDLLLPVNLLKLKLNLKQNWNLFNY